MEAADLAKIAEFPERLANLIFKMGIHQEKQAAKAMRPDGEAQKAEEELADEYQQADGGAVGDARREAYSKYMRGAGGRWYITLLG